MTRNSKNDNVTDLQKNLSLVLQGNTYTKVANLTNIMLFERLIRKHCNKPFPKSEILCYQLGTNKKSSGKPEALQIFSETKVYFLLS